MTKQRRNRKSSHQQKSPDKTPGSSSSTLQTHDHHTRDTHDRLIQAAKTLFAEKGFDGTTVKDLAKAAQVNVSLVSYHLAAKKGFIEIASNNSASNALRSRSEYSSPPPLLKSSRYGFNFSRKNSFFATSRTENLPGSCTGNAIWRS